MVNQMPMQSYAVVVVVIFLSHIGGFKNCLWLLVIAGMTAALMYNIVELTKKYLSHPISVKLSVDHQQQLTFPSVTVCNMNPIKRSAWLAAQNAAAQVKRRKKRSTGIYMLISGHFLMRSDAQNVQ